MVALLIFLALLPARPMPTPEAPFERFTVRTADARHASIAGWILPATVRPRGTIFLTHGFDADRRMFLYWQWVRAKLGWDMVFFDLREFGESSTSPLVFTSLGGVEVMDVRAVIDEAERRRLPQPYVIFSSSLGASVMLREAGTDPRVRGAFVHAPFPNAWYGISHFRWHDLPIGSWVGRVSPGVVRRHYARYDVVAEMAKRDDFRLWITVGDRDWFPAAEQQRMLNALRSPAAKKKLFVRPESWHGDWWRWSPHEATLTAFLKASEGD